MVTNPRLGFSSKKLYLYVFLWNFEQSKTCAKIFLREMAEIDLVYSIWFYVHKRIVDFLSKLMYYIFSSDYTCIKKKKGEKEIIYILYIKLNEILPNDMSENFPICKHRVLCEIITYLIGKSVALLGGILKPLDGGIQTICLSLNRLKSYLEALPYQFSNLWMVAYRPSVLA